MQLPRAFVPLLAPARYKAYYGGRGSAKSRSFAAVLVARAFEQPLKILCCREVQKSVKESVKALVEEEIAREGLTGAFRFLDTEVRGVNGSLFLFEGLRNNPDAIKSMEGLDIAWVEEANRASGRSLELLIPTVRKEGSELWFSWNPELEIDPVDKLFRGPTPPPDAVIRRVTYRDNPWFPAVLERERLHDLSVSAAKHAHVWEGGYKLAWDDVFFDQARLLAMAADLRPPAAVGSLVQVGEQVKFVANVDPWLEVFEAPQRGAAYVLGGDVSEGTSEGDQHSAHVLKRGLTVEQVARFAPQCGPDELGRRMVLAAKWYGQHGSAVPVAPERNNLGIATVIAIQDTRYRHLYTYAEPGEGGGEKAGWVTTKSSRPLMLADLAEAILDGSLVVRSELTRTQLLTFLKQPNGKPEASKGCHDDEVLGLAIAYQLIQRTKPRTEQRWTTWVAQNEL